MLSVHCCPNPFADLPSPPSAGKHDSNFVGQGHPLPFGGALTWDLATGALHKLNSRAPYPYSVVEQVPDGYYV